MASSLPDWVGSEEALLLISQYEHYLNLYRESYNRPYQNDYKKELDAEHQYLITCLRLRYGTPEQRQAAMVEALAAMGKTNGNYNRNKLEQGLGAILEGLDDFSQMDQKLNQILNVCQTHGLMVDIAYLQIQKAIATFEATARNSIGVKDQREVKAGMSHRILRIIPKKGEKTPASQKPGGLIKARQIPRMRVNLLHKPLTVARRAFVRGI